MEYCEKSTLRNVIDQEELFSDPDRVWRLFREIVEGLAHVHAQVTVVLTAGCYTIWKVLVLILIAEKKVEHVQWNFNSFYMDFDLEETFVF